jgi:hypothetical protein
MKPPIVVFLVGALVASAALAAPAYDLHEWGTFTTVAGSDGVLLDGLEREEEGLPAFVHSHDGMSGSGKGLNRPLSGVTVKMETPVIYFYTDEAFRAQLTVGFAGGAISQWYPQRSGGEVVPPLEFDRATGKVTSGAIDFHKPYAGKIQWDVEVLPRAAVDPVKLFKPMFETLTWVRPKMAAAAVVRTGKEYEDFLFYRGVGRLELPLVTRVDDRGVLQLNNRGGDPVPFALVFESDLTGGVRYAVLRDGIKPAATTAVAPADFRKPAEDWVEEVFKEMRAGLTGAGLTAAEAEGMLATWWQSYFGKPGLRIFWILPAAEVDRILPLDVAPAPRTRVRVIVGRSEVLRPEFEAQLVTAFTGTGEAAEAAKWMFQNDRFGLAYAARVAALTATADR